MAAGAQGPRHTFDSEQLWTLLEGEVAVTVGHECVYLTPGDTLVLPAEAERQITATAPVRLLVCGHGNAVASVPDEEAPRGTPPWIA